MIISLIINGIIGAIAGVIVRGRSAGCIGNIIIGAIGGWLGNVLVRFLGGYGYNITAPLAEFLPAQNLVPIAVGLIGSVLLLLIFRTLFGRG